MNKQVKAQLRSILDRAKVDAENRVAIEKLFINIYKQEHPPQPAFTHSPNPQVNGNGKATQQQEQAAVDELIADLATRENQAANRIKQLQATLAQHQEQCNALKKQLHALRQVHVLDKYTWRMANAALLGNAPLPQGFIAHLDATLGQSLKAFGIERIKSEAQLKYILHQGFSESALIESMRQGKVVQTTIPRPLFTTAEFVKRIEAIRPKVQALWDELEGENVHIPD